MLTTASLPMRSTSQASSKMSCSSTFTFDGDDDMSEYEYDYDEDNCMNDQLDGYCRQDDEVVDVEDELLDKFKRRGANGEVVVVVDSTSLTPVMNAAVQSVAEALNIPTSAALISLRRYDWDKQRLLDSFIIDQDKCLTDAGVYCRCNRSDNALEHENKKEQPGMCAICFDDDLKKDQMYAMPCGHTFCVECWVGYISAKLEDGPSCIESTCPDPKCKEILTEEEVHKFTPDLLSKFQSFQLRHYVSCKRNTRWCTGPDCKKVATLPHAQVMNEKGLEIHCQACSTSFCLACGEEPHRPLACKDLKEWKENFSNEGSEKWILNNTKSCPKCKVRIEKNQGKFSAISHAFTHLHLKFISSQQFQLLMCRLQPHDM